MWSREGTSADAGIGPRGSKMSELLQGSGTRPNGTKSTDDLCRAAHSDIHRQYHLSLSHLSKYWFLKIPNTTTMNNFWPVALTSVAMKCLEKIVLQQLNSVVPDTVDPFQLPTNQTDQWTTWWHWHFTQFYNTWTLMALVYDFFSWIIAKPST